MIVPQRVCVKMLRQVFVILALLVVPPGEVTAQDAADVPLDAERLGQLVEALDPGAQAQGNGWRMVIEGQIVLLTTDPAAGRLRAMVPIRAADSLEAPELDRMLRANFDTALDGRYAISSGLVWSLYASPLAGLGKAQLISGLAQVVTLARSYGGAYSSGVMQFGPVEDGETPGGLLRRLLRRGQDI
ncbi:hypothetical protein SAMN05421666_2884 [Roseovarius nanhaiticus]|uniref:Sensory transduction regulator n=2 Tax=Roseovarius nanhaiticus TaxID=573024 RepID=A0A1N7HFF3_9RHOB|nr:hypothetical protein SAMN05216208_2431 [Roseovarius nanhaiticus]SIS23438.1 hypothetical protein SAMN05421666_2884 [Roseovarius nanhaiticus]